MTTMAKNQIITSTPLTIMEVTRRMTQIILVAIDVQQQLLLVAEATATVTTMIPRITRRNAR
jgi:hypothetical protein